MAAEHHQSGINKSALAQKSRAVKVIVQLAVSATANLYKRVPYDNLWQRLAYEISVLILTVCLTSCLTWKRKPGGF